MKPDDRFGPPLSLVEALRADRSPDAAELANLLDEPKGGLRGSRRRARDAGPHWPAIVAGFVLAGGLGGQGHAAMGAAHATAARDLRTAEEPATGCAAEMTLDQLLADPLVRLVMASDRVAEADIRRLMHPRSTRDGAAAPAQVSPTAA